MVPINLLRGLCPLDLTVKIIPLFFNSRCMAYVYSVLYTTLVIVVLLFNLYFSVFIIALGKEDKNFHGI